MSELEDFLMEMFAGFLMFCFVMVAVLYAFRWPLVILAVALVIAGTV